MILAVVNLAMSATALCGLTVVGATVLGAPQQQHQRPTTLEQKQDAASRIADGNLRNAEAIRQHMRSKKDGVRD